MDQLVSGVRLNALGRQFKLGYLMGGWNQAEELSWGLECHWVYSH
jgi:hypothetical protein